MEGVGRGWGVSIIRREAAYREVQDLFDTRDLGEVTVKGKEVPVRTYTVLGERQGWGAIRAEACRPP